VGESPRTFTSLGEGNDRVLAGGKGEGLPTVLGDEVLDIMKIGLIFISFVLFSKVGKAGEWQGFNKAGYYIVMASGNLGAVDSVLSLLEQGVFKDQMAYEGALLMRKAGLLKRSREKLAVFREGAQMLEIALAKDSSNGEYHFLRLIIQENAPGVVHYNKEVEKDCQFVYRSFKLLSPVVQKAILDYSKHSKKLRAKELNG
jgi:hypothetical protein